MKYQKSKWYSYCLNNPLKFTDPNGERWKWWVFGIADILTGGSLSATASVKILTSFTGAIGQSYINAMTSSDNKKAANTFKIWGGLFKTDPDLSFSDRAAQIFSRFTIQDPMTTIGYFAAQGYNMFKQNVDVESFKGATVIYDYHFNNGGAFSAGGYIFMDRYVYKNGEQSTTLNKSGFSNSMLIHEYGHYLQTQDKGGALTLPSSIFSLGDAAVNSAGVHDKLWVERDANARALEYFSGREGFEIDSRNYTKFINSCGDGNIENYNKRFFRWWYLLYPDPIFNIYYNVNNNP